MNAIRNLTVQKQLRAAIAPPFLLFLPWRGRLKTMIPMVSVWCLFQMCVHAAAPNQPTFNSVPSPARLYPYTYPVVVNGPYRVVVDYTDPDGATDLQHVYLQLTGSGAAQTIMYQNMTTPVQWTGEGDHLYNITASKTAIANGYRVTFSFQIKSTWTPSSANVDFVAWGYDKSNVQGTSRTYDWNGTYDNNFRLVDARKTSLVDNDGDGYYSSVTIQADVGSALSSRTSEMLLYRRLDNGTGETNIWDSTQTINGSSVDWKGPAVTVTTRGIYDFYWALYDGSTGSAGWIIDEIWYNEDADISNIPMEPASEDVLNVAPSQSTFNSVPAPARLYPYTFADIVNGPYTVVVDYTDSNGAADLQHVYLQVKGDGTAQTIMYYNLTTPQQWSGEGDHLYNINASKTSIANGYRVTFTFQIKATWTPSINVDFEAWALDKGNLEGTHRVNDWNGIYDNNPRITDARKTTFVDNDGDGYYSSVRIEANAGTSVSSRSVDLLLYRRDSAVGGSGALVWDSGSYTISGATADWQGTTVTVTNKGIYDFGLELYDPAASSWYLANRWYDIDADISNLQMELPAQDAAYTVNGTLDFPAVNNLRWNKIDWGWNAGLVAQNASTNAGILTLTVDPATGIGAQIEHGGHSFGYYSARIKAAPPSTSPVGVCHGFFTYHEPGPEEIDVEILTAKPGYVFFGVTGGELFRVPVPNQSGQYHEYGFLWSASSVQFYLDGSPAVGDLMDRSTAGTVGANTVLQATVPAIAVNHVPQSPTTLFFNNWSGNSWAGYPPSSRMDMLVQDVSWPGRNNAPTDILLSNSTVSENQPVGTTVGTLSTTDPDLDNTFTYSLVAGTGSTDNESFTLSGSALQTAATFNYEAKSSYAIRVRTTDQGGSLYEEAFTITVNNVNETPTDVVLSNSSVQENQPSGTSVGTLSTTDPDTGNTFVYAMVSGTGSGDNAFFTINGSTLQTAASFNYESKSSYGVRIRSTDQGGLWFEKAFTISVTDVAEPPGTPNNVSPNNGATNQSLTLTLQTSAFSDPDIGDSHTASQWLVRRLSDSVVVLDSSEDAANKTSRTISDGVLASSTGYGWQVRYKDNRGLWSSYSVQTTFTTAGPQLQGTKIGSNIVISWPTNDPAFKLFYATNLLATTWISNPLVPTIVSSQYTITNGMTNNARFYRLKK